jgi:hypothetical protein
MSDLTVGQRHRKCDSNAATLWKLVHDRRRPTAMNGSSASAMQVETAKRLLASEGNSGRSSEECAAAAWQVYEKLNARLAPLLGSPGVQMLFARSANLAQAKFESLTKVTTLQGIEKLGACLQAFDPTDATEVAATLFGTFLDLITTFIGERLTVLVLRSAWPTIEDTAPRETKK